MDFDVARDMVEEDKKLKGLSKFAGKRNPQKKAQFYTLNEAREMFRQQT